ncbi:MAG: VWA domain-containing protein [Pseudomonadota bacterium]
MFIQFFDDLRSAGVPVSLSEYLSMLGGLKAGVVGHDAEQFYHFARAALVKDEQHYDRFDALFANFYNGAQNILGEIHADIPAEWLRKQLERHLNEEEKAQVEALGGWDKLMEKLRERLAEQEKRHQGGNKMIGTAGTSPFGAYGYNPEGIRIGQEGSRHRSAVKVWDQRAYRNLDGDRELGTRNIKIALRKLRRFAREGAAEELDLDDTIASTARNAGLLDIKMVPERHNAVKVLIFFDIGGSMDDHIRVCEELFSAARSDFKHLEYYYFHNFLYERVWQDNRRRHTNTVPTFDVMRTYAADYRVIFVGDATMSPYEIAYPGGSVEHWNEESGEVWMRRFLKVYPRTVWLNPVAESRWPRIPSVRMTRELLEDRMFPLTLDGLDRAIKALRKKM